MKRLLIANLGEIAVRIIRAAKDLLDQPWFAESRFNTGTLEGWLAQRAAPAGGSR